MLADNEVRALLAAPGILRLSSNQRYRDDCAAAGGRWVTRASGHRVLYGADGRRVLCVDPGGQVLHECEWGTSASGAPCLLRARVWLDWNAWVGIVPGGLVNATSFDLSTRPGWQRLRAEDLRQMAARAIGVPMSEVQFFYTDDDLQIDPRGRASIRHRKDAFYLLPDGGFDRARFMACMGAMHWADIDFLPVVELFQSLVPGTGSATLELIRELYDDQHPTGDRPLRYRGMPTYPSDAAFGLFGGFFEPRSPSGTQPFVLFMDQARSHEVTWHPSPTPLRRVVDRDAGLCVTTRAGQVTKATLWGDTTGLSFTPRDRSGWSVNGRSLQVANDHLELTDGADVRRMALRPEWGVATSQSGAAAPSPHPGVVSDWRRLFVDGSLVVDAAQAFGAVLLYPEDESPIDHLSSQPFVVDYLLDTFEEDPQQAAGVARARAILIDNMDAGIASLIPLDQRRTVRVLYADAAMAQRQAQRLWNQAARQRRDECLTDVRLLPIVSAREAAYRQRYDCVYHWADAVVWADPAQANALVARLQQTLAPGGVAYVVGPAQMHPLWQRPGLRLQDAMAVDTLPTFRMHLTLLPKARLHPGLTLFCLRRTA
ncbi:MAG: hypothetical protein U0172_01300 [Nitrospiraceae bacterium]